MPIDDEIYSTLSQALFALDNAYGNPDAIEKARDWLSQFDPE